MRDKVKGVLGVGLLAFAPASFADHTLDLTGVGNGTVADGATTQTSYAFAIWNIFDGKPADPDGGDAGLERAAFTAASGGYVASDVRVFTPHRINASQEFLAVQAAPEIDSGSAAAGLTLLLGGVLALRGRRR
jgi:hypothetical protein